RDPAWLPSCSPSDTSHSAECDKCFPAGPPTPTASPGRERRTTRPRGRRHRPPLTAIDGQTACSWDLLHLKGKPVEVEFASRLSTYGSWLPDYRRISLIRTRMRLPTGVVCAIRSDFMPTSEDRSTSPNGREWIALAQQLARDAECHAILSASLASQADRLMVAVSGCSSLPAPRRRKTRGSALSVPSAISHQPLAILGVESLACVPGFPLLLHSRPPASCPSAAVASSTRRKTRSRPSAEP